MPYDIIIGRTPADKEKFEDKGLIYIGKGYVTMGNYTSLSNHLWMDVVKSHVVLISGKRGSGKSYSIGVLAEEISDLPKEERCAICGRTKEQVQCLTECDLCGRVVCYGCIYHDAPDHHRTVCHTCGKRW